MPIVNRKDRIYKKPYKPEYMVALSRDLRKNPTPSEHLLWTELRKRNFFGYHFRRQAPFGRYIFDFYCVKKKLAIELDGTVHDGREKYDAQRDEHIASFGITIIRFSNEAVENNIVEVLKRIEERLRSSTAS